MKNIWCNEISAYLGKEISGVFLLEKVVYSENQSTSWQAMRLVDKTGYVNAKAWAEFINPDYVGYAGSVVKVLGKVEVFRDNYEVRIVKIEPAKKDEYSSNDFYTKISQEEFKLLCRRIFDHIDSVQNPGYKALLNSIFTVNRLSTLNRFPAITKHHHNFGGGWLVHTIEVADLALKCMETCSISPVPVRKIDKDLLITGALLHDIGVVTFYDEGSDLKAPRMTKRGRRVGYEDDSLIFVSCMNNMLKTKVPDMTDLLHVISASHNAGEGVLKEAILLYQAKELSKACSAFDDAFFANETNTFKGVESVYSKFFERTIESNTGGV